MLSLNTSISTAAKAPRPPSSTAGDLSTTMATHTISVTTQITPSTVSRMPLSGRLRVLRLASNRIHMNEHIEHSARQMTRAVYTSVTL